MHCPDAWVYIQEFTIPLHLLNACSITRNVKQLSREQATTLSHPVRKNAERAIPTTCWCFTAACFVMLLIVTQKSIDWQICSVEIKEVEEAFCTHNFIRDWWSLPEVWETGFPGLLKQKKDLKLLPWFLLIPFQNPPDTLSCVSHFTPDGFIRNPHMGHKVTAV